MNLFFILMSMMLFSLPSSAEPFNLTADHISQDAQQNVIAEGSVQVEKSEEILTTDHLYYDIEAHQLQADGNVGIRNPQYRITATSAQLQTESKTGTLQHANIQLVTGEHIQASRLTRVSDHIYTGDSTRISTCPSGDEAWHISADQLYLNQQEGVISAKHAVFYAADVPLFYTPYWQQPLKRRSGLLIPDFSNSTTRGTEFSLPYYWAPSPDWDTTLTPRWMSLRGLLGDIELRHQAIHGAQTVQWSGITDKHTKKYRQHIQSTTQQQLSSNWSFSSHINYVSDHQFLTDFATNPEDTALAYLSSNANLSWQGNNSDVLFMGQYNQALTLPNDQTTLHILPRLESHSALPLEDATLHFDQQTTRFSRALGPQATRLYLHPWLEIPTQWQQGAISSHIQMGIRHLRYEQLNLPQSQKPQTMADISLITRMDMESINSSHTWRHALSPILRYDLAYAPNQIGMVNFDSGFSQLTLGNLMLGNRFVGLDRFERMNRVSFLLENSLQHKSNNDAPAQALLTSSVGVAYDFLRLPVDNNLQASPTRPFSNLVGSLALTPTSWIRLDSDGQYNPVGHYWATSQAALHLQHHAGAQLNLGWQRTDVRYTTPSETLRSELYLPLQQRWSVSSNTLYDGKLKRTQSSSLGVHYQHPCWSLQTELFRTYHTGIANQPNTGFHFLLGFHGLSSVGGN